MDVVRIGTRGSKLSLLQTGIVARKLELLGVGIKCELVQIKTLNEKIDRNSGKPTEKDIYTKEIDEALIDGSIDIAVHIHQN
ncbi:MAG: hydroxymethylbilane synthase, partial [Candidatus Marsarchaeota archaeon]|nr:hydroxymethylbilane synthase [Candidatus Marsarchaeota archaeon]